MTGCRRARGRWFILSTDHSSVGNIAEQGRPHPSGSPIDMLRDPKAQGCLLGASGSRCERRTNRRPWNSGHYITGGDVLDACRAEITKSHAKNSGRPDRLLAAGGGRVAVKLRAATGESASFSAHCPNAPDAVLDADSTRWNVASRVLLRPYSLRLMDSFGVREARTQSLAHNQPAGTPWRGIKSGDGSETPSMRVRNWFSRPFPCVCRRRLPPPSSYGLRRLPSHRLGEPQGRAA